MRDVVLNLDAHSCMLLIASINAYQEVLQERYKSTEYFFTSYKEEKKKQLSEDNYTALMARMYQVDNLKSYLLSSIPVDVYL